MAVHGKRERLNEDMLRNSQKTSLNEMPLIKRTDEWLPENLSRMT